MNLAVQIILNKLEKFVLESEEDIYKFYETLSMAELKELWVESKNHNDQFTIKLINNEITRRKESPHKMVQKPCPNCGKICEHKEYDDSTVYTFTCNSCKISCIGGAVAGAGGGTGKEMD